MFDNAIMNRSVAGRRASLRATVSAVLACVAGTVSLAASAVPVLPQAGGYGVGVASSIWSAYFVSIATRICLRLMPSSSICITSRVTPRQMPQVGAIESKTTEPSGFTRCT